MITITTSQKQLIVSLAEPMLRRDGTGLSEIPSSAAAAARPPGAPPRTTRTPPTRGDNRDRRGVPALRGGPGALATNRRARLVEYAVASRLVTAVDLPLLDLTDDG